MKTNHTDSRLPWRVEECNDGIFQVWTKADHAIGSRNNYAIADGIQDAKEAKLIAAAPELLEACKEALQDYAGCNVERFTAAETAKMNRLRQAIAKARGQE